MHITACVVTCWVCIAWKKSYLWWFWPGARLPGLVQEKKLITLKIHKLK